MNYARGAYAARPETIFDDLDIWVEAEVHDGEHVEERQGGGRDIPQEIKFQGHRTVLVCAPILHQAGLGGDVVSCDTHHRLRYRFLNRLHRS